LPPRAGQAVELARDALLAGAGLAQDQDRRRVGRRPRHQRAQAPDVRRVARDRVARRRAALAGAHAGGDSVAGVLLVDQQHVAQTQQ
jgi:hypothetical protein